MKSEKFEKLSQKFGVANKISEELEALVSEIETPIDTSIQLCYETNIESVKELTPIEEPIEEPVFTIAQLKTDFLLMKQNLSGLISKGQRILDSAMLLDISDLKASQLDALTNLQNSIASNLKLMFSIYKEIAEIEKIRLKQSNKTDSKLESISSVNMGSVTNNQILFTGSPNDLLDMINKQKS